MFGEGEAGVEGEGEGGEAENRGTQFEHLWIGQQIQIQINQHMITFAVILPRKRKTQKENESRASKKAVQQNIGQMPKEIIKFYFLMLQMTQQRVLILNAQCLMPINSITSRSMQLLYFSLIILALITGLIATNTPQLPFSDSQSSLPLPHMGLFSGAETFGDPSTEERHPPNPPDKGNQLLTLASSSEPNPPISPQKQNRSLKQISRSFPLQPLKKCNPASQFSGNFEYFGAPFEEEFCLMTKQEFISKEQIINNYIRDTHLKEKEDEENQQQYVWIALTCAILLGAYLYYKMKIYLLLQVMEQVEIKADIQVSEYQQKLQEFSELRKIYEIYWDLVVYKNEVDVCYDHTVYQGRFLTQQTYVYAVRLQHADIGTLEYKLGRLLNCSHRRLAKLYYYTKTPDFMLIFTQKITPLSSKDLKEHFTPQTALATKKTFIIDIIETLSYLEEKIQLKLLPLESIQLDIVTRSPGVEFYDYKINTIPCLFRKMNYNCFEEDFDTASEDQPICLVRLNIVSLFHLVLLEGRIFNREEFSRLTKEQTFCNEQYIQFLDFILYQAKAIGHTHELLFNEVLEHPFLWDSKRKILFLADFSNYIETHLDEARLYRLEKHAHNHRIIRPNWIKQFHSVFASQVNFYRKYNFQSIRDLIRMIRNKLNHFHQIPREVKTHIGKTPEGFIEYCLTIFPKLLPFAYIYTRKKKWKLHMK